MKMKNRFLGILLSLVMVLGLMPGMSLTAYANNMDIGVGTTWNIGDSFNLSGKYFKRDDKSLITPILGADYSGTVPTPEYRDDLNQWAFYTFCYYENILVTGGIDKSSFFFSLPDGKTGQDVPSGLKIKSGDGSEASPYVFELVYSTAKTTPVVDNFTYTGPSPFPTYDGTPKTATVVPKEGVTGMGAVTVHYYSDAECGTENEVENPTDAGEYYVGITVAEGDNYSAVSNVLHDSNWKFTINRATPIATNFTYNAPSDLTYNGTAKTATVVPNEGITGMGNVTVKYYSDQYCSNEVTPTNVGTYYVGITLSEGNNYHNAYTAFYDQNWHFTISKQGAPTSLNDNQKPTANTGLTYTRSEQVLVTAPASALTGYTVQYSLDGTNWSTELPKGTNAGDYTVKVKYVGDSNHEDFNGTDISVSIGKGTAPTLTDGQKPTAKSNLVYSGSEQELIDSPQEKLPNPYVMKYAVTTENTAPTDVSAYDADIPKGSEAKTYYVWYKIVGDDNHSDYVSGNPIIVTISKKTEPSDGGCGYSVDPVKQVIDKINALPAADKVTTADKAVIEEARQAYEALSAEQKAKISADTLNKLKDAESALAAAVEKSVKTVTVNAKTVSAKTLKAAVAKAGGSSKYVRTIVLGKKVKKISKGAFKNYKSAKTLIVKTKKLKKASVKKSLKGSKITNVKVRV